MLTHQLTQDDLCNVENIGLWRKIIELYSYNGKLRSDCGVKDRKAVKTALALALNSYDAGKLFQQNIIKLAQEHAQNPELREHKQESRPNQELTVR